MASRYEQRLSETRGRPYSENIALYKQRKANNQDVGVLERVIAEQATGATPPEGSQEREY